jgi:hypothetical protein
MDSLLSPGNAGEGADMAISRSDARQAATAALQSLSKWHDEVVAANERCLADVLEQTAAAARAVGWPEHVINATRDQLLNASQLQTQAIDHLSALWKKQLESSTSPMPVARSLLDPTPRILSSNYPGSMPEIFGVGGQPFAPLLLWVQTAELWQRNWIQAMSFWADALAFPSTQEDRSAERSRSAARH